jgi:hypothetical protein
MIFLSQIIAGKYFEQFIAPNAHNNPGGDGGTFKRVPKNGESSHNLLFLHTLCHSRERTAATRTWTPCCAQQPTE